MVFDTVSCPDPGVGPVHGGHVTHFPRSGAANECPDDQRRWACLCAARDGRSGGGGAASSHERGEA